MDVFLLLLSVKENNQKNVRFNDCVQELYDMDGGKNMTKMNGGGAYEFFGDAF